MKLLVDIGNTTTEFGLLHEGEFSYVGRIIDPLIELDSIKKILNGVKVDEIYISSVAPNVCNKLKEILKSIYSIESKVIDVTMDVDLKIEIDHREELGADLLCDLVGAYKYYGSRLAIVDFGTATKILFIDKDGVFNSCAIFPGYEKSKRILANTTELLPMVENIKIKPISECHNTKDVINSSAYYSQLFTVDGIIKK